MSEIQRLREIVAKLRAPDGCPWDIEQTHQSLSRCLIEETSEVLETIDDLDMPAMREELGDLLLQVVMHSQIAEESESFDLEDVAREINEKLIRRHPHVFGEGAELQSADEVLSRWDEIKAAEKAAKGLPANERKIFRDLPPRLPALLFALDVFKRAEKAGLTEKASLCNERGNDETHAISDESKLGRELFLLVTDCRKAGVDPESALRRYASNMIEELEPRPSLEKN